MLFTSISFIYYFLPIVIITYFIAPKRIKNVVLFISSIMFYFFGEPKYIILMLAEILIAYIIGILIDKQKSKYVLIMGIIIHIGLLCIYKYTDFLITNINAIANSGIPLLRLAIPIRNIILYVPDIKL